MINFVYLESSVVNFGFFAFKNVDLSSVEIWVATSEEPKLFGTYSNPSTTRFESQLLTVGELSGGSFNIFLDVQVSLPPLATGPAGANPKLISSNGSVIAERLVRADNGTIPSVGSGYTTRQGYWVMTFEYGQQFPDLGSTIATPDNLYSQDRLFNTQSSVVQIANNDYALILPSLSTKEGEPLFTALSAINVTEFVPTADYSGALGFEVFATGSNAVPTELLPKAWVSNAGNITNLAGGVAQPIPFTGIRRDLRALGGEWVVDFPYAYRLGDTPSFTDISVQSRTIQKWQIDLTAGTFSFLGNLSYPLAGFNDLDLKYSAWIIPLPILAGLEIT